MPESSKVVQAAVDSKKDVVNLETAILEAVAEARSTCEVNGSSSSDCAVAWDIVEELQAEKSHQKQARQNKNSLDSHCDRHPNALECRVYDI